MLFPMAGFYRDDRRQSVVQRRPLTGVCLPPRAVFGPAFMPGIRVARHGARPVDGPSRWEGLEPDGFREDIKISRHCYGERWQSGSNASRMTRNRPKRRHSEKPRERGLRFGTGAKPRPGVKRRAEDRLGRERPVNGPSGRSRTQCRQSEDARQRAFGLADSPARPAPATKKVVLGKTPQLLEK